MSARSPAALDRHPRFRRPVHAADRAPRFGTRASSPWSCRRTLRPRRSAAWNPAGIILSGGPQSVYEDDAPLPASDPTALGVPVLGLCYGMQWMAQAAGGEVANAKGGSTGGRPRASPADSELFAGPRAGADGLDEPRRLGRGAAPPASESSPRRRRRRSPAFENPARRVYGLQFHPEVRHTVHGTEILQNFLFRICKVRARLDDGRIPPGEGRGDPDGRRPTGPVICALSGGVDSSVTAILLREALGDRVHPILVDHGLMRAHERQQVVEAFVAPRDPGARGGRRRISSSRASRA